MKESNSTANGCHAEFMLFREYLDLRWPILPLHSIRQGQCSCRNPACSSPGKHPRTIHGLKDASIDPEQISSWWARWPDANVGILTGSQTGLIVIDIDEKSDGYASLAQIEDEIDDLPESYRVQSGGGGLHIYFTAPISPVKSRVGFRPGIDIRAEGAYIVAPPSIHISGNPYHPLSEKIIAPLPSAFLKLLASPTEKLPTDELMTGIGKGKRNDTLAGIAGYLRSKGLNNQQLEKSLQAINDISCQPPLPPDELKSITSSIGQYPAKAAWPEPLPLNVDIITPEPLLSEDLPLAIRKWCLDASDRMQVPIEFVAAPLIVAAASVIGRKMGIHPLRNDPWTVIPNLWGFIVAEPGSLKTAAISESMKPLEMLAKKATKKYAAACKDAQLKYREIQLEIEALRQSLKVDLSGGFKAELGQQKKQICHLETTADQSKEVAEKRYKTNDPTVEKLAMILKENPQGLLLLRDELSGWLDSLYKSGREGSREFYLEAWNGNSSYSIDRVGRGTMHVEALCLSVFGGIQPAKLEEYIERHSTLAGDDGFLERFQIVVYPAINENWKLVDRKPDQAALNDVIHAFNELDEIPDPSEGVSTIAFNEEAQALSDRWRKLLEDSIRSNSESAIIRSHLSKYRSLMPSLALIFQLMDDGNASCEVSLASTQRAVRWCKVLETHIRKVYQSTLHNKNRGAEILAKKIKADAIGDGCKMREILRKNWAGLRTTELLEPAIAQLTNLNWVRVEKLRTAGGISERLLINPNLKSHGGNK